MYESKRDAEFQTLAYIHLRRFAKLRKHRAFLAEEFRAWLEKHHPDLEPKDWRSLGCVFSWAKGNGMIACAGSAPARTSHGNWKPKWVGCR